MQNELLDNLIHHDVKDGQNRDPLLSAKGNKLSVISWERI